MNGHEAAAMTRYVAQRLVAGQPVELTQLPCSCGAAAVGSDAHYPGCDMVLAVPVGFEDGEPQWT